MKLKKTLIVISSLLLVAALLYIATIGFKETFVSLDEEEEEVTQTELKETFVSLDEEGEELTQTELKEFFVSLDEQGKEFTQRELIDCNKFLTERNAWREDFEFLASLGENMFDVFLESWENERQCLYSQVDQSYDFIANYRDGLKDLNTDVTDFQKECDDILSYSGEQLDLYDVYRENIDRQIDAEIERYSCRIEDRNDGEELDTDWLDVTLSKWDDCEEEFLTKQIEIEKEYNRLWRDLMQKQNKTYEIILKVHEGLGVESELKK